MKGSKMRSKASSETVSGVSRHKGDLHGASATAQANQQSGMGQKAGDGNPAKPVLVTPTILGGGNRPTVTLYHADCLEIRHQLNDADVVITDPPYGMNNNADTSRFSGGSESSIARRGGACEFAKGRKPIFGDDKPFNPEPWMDFEAVVLFGYQHFSNRLPVGTILIWLKRLDAGFGSFLSDAELAWCKGGCGVYAKRDLSMNSESRIRKHPNQKPVPIMSWCMEMAKVPKGATVLDPYMGSGTTAIACIRTGRNFIGVEIDKRHFDNAVSRIDRELAQGDMFV